MKKLYSSIYNHLTHALAILLCTAIIAFSIIYIFSDYSFLSRWYLSLNECIYKGEDWRIDFFDNHTKQIGNYLHIIAIVVCLCFIIININSIRKFKPLNNISGISLKLKNLFPEVLLAISGILLWMLSNSLTSPAYDEIFSAVNCADIHPIQTVSYYMVPNNHLLFNFLNSFLSNSFDDTVLSGRILSLFFFLIFQQIVFLLLKDKLSLPAAILTTLVLSVTLPTLGFASQARGYMLHLMAGWLMLYGYIKFLKETGVKPLQIMTLGIFLGYSSLPSFLLFHIPLVLFAIYWQISRKNFQYNWWKYQIISIALVFLFYLPAFSFSGIAAFVSNPYVKAEEIPLGEFANNFIAMFPFFMDYGFSNLFLERDLPLYLLYASPIFVLFIEKGKYKDIIIFYFIVIISTVLVTLLIKKIPFSRNFIIQYSVGFAIILYSFYLYLTTLLEWLNRKSLVTPFYSGFILIIILLLLRKFPELASENLYFNNTKNIYKINSKDVKRLPFNESIGFSDGSFYWFYLARLNGKTVTQCPSGDEAYIVKRMDEIFPTSNPEHYEKMEFSSEDGYEIFKLR